MEGIWREWMLRAWRLCCLVKVGAFASDELDNHVYCLHIVLSLGQWYIFIEFANSPQKDRANSFFRRRICNWKSSGIYNTYFPSLENGVYCICINYGLTEPDEVFNICILMKFWRNKDKYTKVWDVMNPSYETAACMCMTKFRVVWCSFPLFVEKCVKSTTIFIQYGKKPTAF